jgi:hypothetical protein
VLGKEDAFDKAAAEELATLPVLEMSTFEERDI